MPYTAQFFAEKLNVPVEYFNPLRNVQIDPALNLEELARVAHSLGEVVGLGLRNLAHCPVELNLMPESTLKWQAFNQKKPYFIATVLSLVAGVVAMGFLFDKLAGVKNAELDKIHPEVEAQQRKSEQFKKAYHSDLKKAEQEVDQAVDWMTARYYWADVFTELRLVLIRAEEKTRHQLRTDTGVWIDELLTAAPSEGASATAEGSTPAFVTPDAGMNAAANEAFRRRYGLSPAGAPPPPPPPPPADGAAAADGGAGGPKKAKGGTNEIASMTIKFRAVSWTSISPDANKETAYTVLTELKNSPLFDADETKFSTDVGSDEPPGTFTFSILATLKHPLKL